MASTRTRLKTKPMRKMVHEADMLSGMAARFYNEVNPRRKQEIMDSRMIQEDHSAVANLSGKFINKRFDASRFVESLGRCDEMSEVGE